MKVDLAGCAGAIADAAVSSSAGVAQPATLMLAMSPPCPHVPSSCWPGAGEMDVAAFILVPCGSAAGAEIKTMWASSSSAIGCVPPGSPRLAPGHV